MAYAPASSFLTVDSKSSYHVMFAFRSRLRMSFLCLIRWTGGGKVCSNYTFSTALSPTRGEQLDVVDFSAHRTQALHIVLAEGESPPPHKLLDKLPVGRLVDGAVAAVEVLLADLPLVVFSQARANHVPVGDLSLASRRVPWGRFRPKERAALDCIENAATPPITRALPLYCRAGVLPRQTARQLEKN